MPTVTVLIGPPAAGKSTYAKEMLTKNPRLVRLNRDDFRMSLFGLEILTSPEEKRVSGFLKTIGRAYLKAGYSLVLDNTHCQATTLLKVIEDYNDLASVDYVLFDVPYKTLLERNASRDRNVPEDVIKRMAGNFHHLTHSSFDFSGLPKRELLSLQTTLLPVVVFDIDSTLALKGKRGTYNFDKCSVDIPIDITVAIAKMFIRNFTQVLFVTGRDNAYRAATLKWLQTHVDEGIVSEELFMRPEKDMRTSFVVKEEILLENILPTCNPVAWFDDDASVTEMLRGYGILTYNC